ncbi:sulfotransferase [Tsuneonella sp. SYSU-LHT278]|uniref:sulfotransferase n=1 Tax=Tsuneonella sediminis TaxID=3416089 RepID=UPI003F79CA36
MAPPRPHPLAVAPAARLADRAVAAIWRSGIAPRPPLDPDALWRVGARGFGAEDEAAGRSEEDRRDFRERLDRLCRSLTDEARLNALGHTMAYGQLTGAIRKRHALGRLWCARPDLATAPIAPPIVIAGQMRSGTTRIHRLLAADPALAATRFCNSFDPVPARPDWRPLKAAFALAVARRINPWLDTFHPFGATRADEEIGWLSAALSPCAYEAQWHIPSYVAWSEASDPAPVYREFARVLRTDAVAMRDAARPRVLKCPQYAEDLPALLAQFPDARVIVTSRASDAVLDSTVSMVAGQSAFQSRMRDAGAIRTEWRRKLALREKRLESALAAHRGPVAHVSFEDLDTDWRSAIAGVYALLGLALLPAAREAMEREQRIATRSPHRAHARTVNRFADASG